MELNSEKGINKISKIDLNSLMRTYLIDVLVFLFCVAYILSGLLEVVETGKTPLEIIWDGVKAFLGFWLVTTAMNMQGLMDGEKNPQFIATMSEYGKILDIITPKIQNLDDFCEMKYQKKVESAQRHILVKVGLSYDLWKDGKCVPHSKEQEDAINRCYKVKIRYISSEELTSDAENIDKETGLGKGKQEYLKSNITTSIISKVAVSVVLGVFSLDMIADFSWGNLLYDFLQVCGFLVSGGIKYLMAYMFINNEYKTRIIRKTNLLYEFSNGFTPIEKGVESGLHRGLSGCVEETKENNDNNNGNETIATNIQ